MQSLEQSIGISYPDDNAVTLPGNLVLALHDIITGLISKRSLWLYLGMIDTRRRYKRTVIGPFWTTLSLGLFIGCMGVLLSTAWNAPVKDFLPYFCSGYICWMLLQSVISEGCTTFTAHGTYVLQISLPYTIYSCLLVWRNVIVLFHHLVIMGLVLIYSHLPINTNILLFIPGLLLVFLTSVWVTTLLGMACARYRDIQQIVSSVLQLAMFITPVMWKPEQLGHRGILAAEFNPLYHFISIIRLPMIGEAPSMANWMWSLSVFAIGAIITTLIFAKNYKKIVFWL